MSPRCLRSFFIPLVFFLPPSASLCMLCNSILRKSNLGYRPHTRKLLLAAPLPFDEATLDRQGHMLVHMLVNKKAVHTCARQPNDFFYPPAATQMCAIAQTSLCATWIVPIRNGFGICSAWMSPVLVNSFLLWHVFAHFLEEFFSKILNLINNWHLLVCSATYCPSDASNGVIDL